MVVNPSLENWVTRQSTVKHEDYTRCAHWPVIYIRRLTEHPDDRNLRLTSAMHTMEVIYQIYPGDAVNEQREFLAKDMLQACCRDYGFEYEATEKSWNGFPDGRATINGASYNVEATSVMPLTTSGIPITKYMRLMGESHISHPRLAPIRHCVTSPCPPQTLFGPEAWYVRKHPADHTYFEVWPPLLASEFFPIIERGGHPLEVPYIVASQVHHTRSMFVSQFQAALDRKAMIIQDKGQDHKNCLIVLSEGMIPRPEWIEDISFRNCACIDSVVLVAVDGYVGMIHNLNFAKRTLSLVLKCGFCGKKDCLHAPSHGTFAEFMEGHELPTKVTSQPTKIDQIYEMTRLTVSDFLP